MESLTLYENMEEIESESDLVLPDDEDSLLSHCKDLGQEVQTKEDVFKQTVKTTIEQAYEIGRIAFEARESIKRLPTKEQKAKLMKVSKKSLDYSKPTFEDCIETYTKIGKDTIYAMIKLYKCLKENPDYVLPEDSGWRECLGFFSIKQVFIKHDGTEGLEGEETKSEETENGTTAEYKKFASERKAFSKLYKSIDADLADYLQTSESDELRNVVAVWKNFLTNDLLNRKIETHY